MSASKPAVIVVVLIAIAGLGIMMYINNHKKIPTESVDVVPGTIRYLPLGDSYTIGESVAEAERWPNQLAIRFATEGKTLQIVANPAVTGYTTQNLIDKELSLATELKPDFVTIQIGVNDYVQGVPAATFQKNLEYIVTKLQMELDEPQNVLLVTIPDYGKTPAGAQFGDPTESEAGIKNFNSIIKQVAAAHNFKTADIFPVSQNAGSDRSLIAKDGLHPSAKQYTDWTNVIFQVMLENKLPESLTKSPQLK